MERKFNGIDQYAKEIMLACEKSMHSIIIWQIYMEYKTGENRTPHEICQPPLAAHKER